MSAKRLKAIARHFRVLRGWTVTYGSQGGKQRKQAAIVVKMKRLHVYPFDRRLRLCPDEYLLHEVLHAALIAVREEGVSHEKRKKREELLVQDLCNAIASQGNI